jgi:hypothetical protein
MRQGYYFASIEDFFNNESGENSERRDKEGITTSPPLFPPCSLCLKK